VVPAPKIARMLKARAAYVIRLDVRVGTECQVSARLAFDVVVARVKVLDLTIILGRHFSGAVNNQILET
jgi:hypothetical protein